MENFHCDSLSENGDADPLRAASIRANRAPASWVKMRKAI